MTNEQERPHSLGIPLKDLETRWNIGRNPVKRRAEFLGVKLLKPDYLTTLWPLEYLQLGDDLQEWVQQGNQMKFFPPIYEQDPQSVSLRQVDTGAVEIPASTTVEPVESQTGGLAHRQSHSLTETQPQAIQTGVVVDDITEKARRLEWGLKRPFPLTEEEFAWVCMTDEQTLKDWSSPQRIRPRLTAHRTWMGRGKNRQAHWELKLAHRHSDSQTDQGSIGESVSQSLRKDRGTDRQVGFDVTAAVIDVPAIDCTGSSLMAQNRIS